jgi:hypothetical protein
MAVIINIVTLNMETSTNCQVCSVYCAYLSISMLCLSRLQGLGHLQFREYIVFLCPLALTSNPIPFQIFAYSAFALSSLLIILRMYVFYPLGIRPSFNGGGHWFPPPA